jgi:hypothetical protein
MICSHSHMAIRRTPGRLARSLAAVCALGVLRGAVGVLDCSTYEDAVGARLFHTKSRTAPCDAKGQGATCTYLLNLTRPDGSLHTTDLAVNGCCVRDLSGEHFCSSQRSKDASSTALTVKKLLNISYECQGGRTVTTHACDPALGFQTFCQPGSGSPDDNCQVRCGKVNVGQTSLRSGQLSSGGSRRRSVHRLLR